MSCKTCGGKACAHNSLINNLQKLVKAIEEGKYNAKPASKLVQGSCHCTDPRCKWEGHRP